MSNNATRCNAPCNGKYGHLTDKNGHLTDAPDARLPP